MDGIEEFSPLARISLPGYRFHKTIGKGQFGKVKLASHVLTGEKVCQQDLIMIQIITGCNQDNIKAGSGPRNTCNGQPRNTNHETFTSSQYHPAVRCKRNNPSYIPNYGTCVWRRGKTPLYQIKLISDHELHRRSRTFTRKRRQEVFLSNRRRSCLHALYEGLSPRLKS
jgi:hypothetical protein